MFDDRLQITILGSGSWGSTLAWLWSSAGHQTTLWTRQAEKADLINSQHRIDHPVKVVLSEQVTATADLDKALAGAEVVVFCCPSQALRALADQVFRNLQEQALEPIIVSAVKGLETSSLKRMSEVLTEVMPGFNVAALSGPNLASEIIAGLPAAAVIGCAKQAIAHHLQKSLNMPLFRLYYNTDIAGIELGGTLKNVIAIAAGASDGLKLGANAKAALLTRGLAEMTRLAVKLGGQASTLAGLTGMGDLLATCAGPASRNYRLGLELAKGRTTQEILQELAVAVEGVPTTKAVCELSIKLEVELPIAEQVDATLNGRTSPDAAIRILMTRPLSSEY